jgi:hypothetical protein
MINPAVLFGETDPRKTQFLNLKKGEEEKEKGTRQKTL